MNVEVLHPDIVASVAARLSAAGVASPRADARWLVDHVVAAAGSPAGRGAALLDALVTRRLAREPLQLILGVTAFRTVEVLCRPGVFIPRPETEIVAGIAIDVAGRAGPSPVVVDACTGTGAIACSLLAEVPGVRVVATDDSALAVELARDNLLRVAAGEVGPGDAAPGARADVVGCHLLDGVDDSLRERVDVLVANPPYLPRRDAGSFEPEVSDHDPPSALLGGDDGHEVVDELLLLAMRWLAPGGTVVVEIDERRGTHAMARAAAVGLVDVRIERDLTGADRVLVARRSPVPPVRP